MIVSYGLGKDTDVIGVISTGGLGKKPLGGSTIWLAQGSTAGSATAFATPFGGLQASASASGLATVIGYGYISVNAEGTTAGTSTTSSNATIVKHAFAASNGLATVNGTAFAKLLASASVDGSALVVGSADRVLYGAGDANGLANVIGTGSIASQSIGSVFDPVIIDDH